MSISHDHPTRAVLMIPVPTIMILLGMLAGPIYFLVARLDMVGRGKDHTLLTGLWIPLCDFDRQLFERSFRAKP
jgi:hypothetical protein